MISQIKYQINPDIIWVNESNGRIVLIMPDIRESICLNGFDAAMWRSIWQGISPLMRKHPIEEQANNAMDTIKEWIKAGLIKVVHS